MKLRSFIFFRVTAGCAAGVLLAASAAAAVSDEEFEALKKSVQEMGVKIKALEATHQADQSQITQMKQQLGETQVAATNAQQTAESAASKVESVMTPGRTASHNFMMVGDAEVQWGKMQDQHSAFVLADFAPIFLFRASENVLFEAGFDFTLANNVDANGKPNGGSSTQVGLSFAQLDYMFNDYATFIGGDMLLPLGTYSERSAGWLNKIPDDPLARDLLPGSGIGVQVRGAVPIGQSGPSLTYSLYGANGPSSTDGTGNRGALDLGGNVGDTPNLHSDPSGGGRIGYFHPWKPHYDFELGISGQSGVWDNGGNRLWSAAVLDAALHLGPSLEIKGEYINTWVQTDNAGTYRPKGGWVQAAYKLSGLNLELPVINNIELLARYDRSNDGLGTKTDRGTFGYVYYFTDTLLFEGDYEILHSHGPNALPESNIVFQLSYGF